MQTASAFSAACRARCRSSSPSTAQLAEWRAVVTRLDGFEAAIAAARDLATRDDSDSRRRGRGRRRDRPARAWRCACRTARRWSPPMASACARASARCSPARPAPANRRCSAPSPASGRSAPARSPYRRGNIDDAAAAAVFPDRIAARGDRLSRPRRARFTDSQISGCARTGRTAASSPSQLDEERALESDAVARRAAAPRARTRAVARAAISVPRRSDRLARRTLGGRAVSSARGETADDHHRLDRPSLDARCLPPAQCRAGPRRRSVRAAGRRSERRRRS